MTAKVNINEITRRALNGASNESNRHDAVLELFKTPERVERLEEYSQLLLSLVENPALADSLHRARYHYDSPLVQRTEALKIGQIVIELFNAGAEKFVQDQIDHWGLTDDPEPYYGPEGAA